MHILETRHLTVSIWIDQDLPDKFRREYTSLWKSLFTVDTAEIQRIAGEWFVFVLTEPRTRLTLPALQGY